MNVLLIPRPSLLPYLVVPVLFLASKWAFPLPELRFASIPALTTTNVLLWLNTICCGMPMIFIGMHRTLHDAP